jgi:predicted TIM-barrel fold metal-dependent hydrolase
VKLSVWDRVHEASHIKATIDDLQPIVKAFVAANPDRILYGSDWPHCAVGKPVMAGDENVVLEDFRVLSDEIHIQKLREWVPDSQSWQKIFKDNPNMIFR